MKEQQREENQVQKEEVSKEEVSKEETRAERRRRFQRTRLIPIWLRLIIVAVLMGISLAAGAMIGYGVIGDGNPFDVFQPSTWQHIIDIVEKDTNSK
jgi:anti-sigma factor RsiW